MVMKRAYNAANTTETVDTDLDNHDCGLLEAEAEAVSSRGIDDKRMMNSL
jgi:hypothetical protein